MKKDLPKAWKMPRPADEIQKEYAQLCAVAGDKQYKVDLMKAELMELNKKLFELNQEHAASLQATTATTKSEEVLTPQSQAPTVDEVANEASAQTA